MAANVLEVTDSNFATLVEKNQGLFLLDFWATWCGPCLAIAPHVEALATEYAGRAHFGKVDIDSHPHTASQFGIRSIPTLILFKDGQPVDQVIGSVPKSQLENMIKKHL